MAMASKITSELISKPLHTTLHETQRLNKKSLQWFRKEPEMQRARDIRFLMHLYNDVKKRMQDGTIPECLTTQCIAKTNKLGMSEIALAYAASSPFAAGIETVSGRSYRRPYSNANIACRLQGQQRRWYVSDCRDRKFKIEFIIYRSGDASFPACTKASSSRTRRRRWSGSHAWLWRQRKSTVSTGAHQWNHEVRCSLDSIPVWQLR